MSNMVKPWMCHTSVLIKVVGKNAENNRPKQLNGGISAEKERGEELVIFPYKPFL